MLIGYARVSTAEQNLDLQTDALTAAGCEEIVTDQVSGSRSERPGLSRVMQTLRRGDTLVVWRLDRLGRSLPHLVQLTVSLEEKGVGFKSLSEQLDTTTAAGKLVFHVFAAIADFERNLIRERTRAGLASARARGRKGGRPRKLTPKQVAQAKALYADPTNSPDEIAHLLHVSRPTLYRYLQAGQATENNTI